jgi:hypothetical protein
VETCVVRLYVRDEATVDVELRGQVEIVAAGRTERFSSADQLVAILHRVVESGTQALSGR